VGGICEHGNEHSGISLADRRTPFHGVR